MNRKIDEVERNKRNTMKKTLLLASASPRRKEILEQAGFSFEILAANADENIQEADPAEMVKKLSEGGYNEEVIARVMAFLVKYGYIDDRVYCQKYIKETIKLRPKGKFLIKQELRQRGIDENIIDEEMEGFDIVEVGQAEELLMKKYEDFASMDQKELARVYGFLQRKGYSYSVIKAAVRSLAEKGI